jgi:hypothetical protein
MLFQANPAQQEQQLMNQLVGKHQQLISQVNPYARNYQQLVDIIALLSNWYNTLQTDYVPQANSLYTQGYQRLLPMVQTEIQDVWNGITLYCKMRDDIIAPPPPPVVPSPSTFDDWLANQNRNTQRNMDIIAGNCVVCHKSIRGVPQGAICPHCGRYQN